MDVGELRDLATDLPRAPGVYQFHGPESVLYVGKAVDLRSRVKSYAAPRSDRIARMRRKATDLDVAVTDTETQAVLLEANLIKRFQPRYNVLLTDDKSYPLIQITDHEAPRIEITRDPDDGAHVYGPFTRMGRVETVVKAIRDVFGLRACSDRKYAGRDRPCQDYEIGLCTAPCTGEIDPEAYLGDVESVKQFLRGATGVLADPLEERMNEAASSWQFERAANLRDRLDATRALHGGMADAVYSRTEETDRTDVLATAFEGDWATVARLTAESGKLVDRSRHRLEAPSGETTASVLAAFIPQFYSDRELPSRLLLSDHPEDREVTAWLASEGVALSIPDTGRERRLVDLALQNARRRFSTREATRELAHELGLDGADRIEGFDVSHAGGKAAVGSNVLFVDGQPEKSGYRRKRLDDRNDDYANMRRLVHWRARRALEGRDDRPDPDLLLIDGGDGQREAARSALEEAGWEIPAIALAKEEALVYADSGVYNWESSASQLHLLQRVRDEAHRFAVRYHRTVRDDVSTLLEDVPGVGEKLERRLLRRFGSIDGIRDASVDELMDVDGLGSATATTLASHL